MQKNTSRALAKSLLLAACLSLGCAEGDIPLRVGLNAWPGYSPAFIAQAMGYFRGAPVKLAVFPSSGTPWEPT
jgi:ABC-type nitrate/sulfonate/bicarbonate transport system substrate-binding protein